MMHSSTSTHAPGCSLRGYLGPALALASALVIVSCGPLLSSHSFATSSDTLCDEALRGRWNFVSPGLDRTASGWLDLESGNGSRWLMKTSKGRLECEPHLIRLAQRWFMDVRFRNFESSDFPAHSDSALDWLRQVHLLYRLDLVSDTLSMACLDDDRVQAYARRHPGELRFTGERDSVVLANPTPELQRFVEQIADVDSLFTQDARLVRPHGSRRSLH
jgi:hypothetical protein